MIENYTEYKWYVIETINPEEINDFELLKKYKQFIHIHYGVEFVTVTSLIRVVQCGADSLHTILKWVARTLEKTGAHGVGEIIIRNIRRFPKTYKDCSVLLDRGNILMSIWDYGGDLNVSMTISNKSLQKRGV